MLLSKAIASLLVATRVDGRSERTVKFYRDELAHLLRFLGDVPIVSVTIDDLRAFIDDQMRERILHGGQSTRKPQRGRFSPHTIRARVRAMKRLFNWLVEEGHLEASPAQRVKMPRLKNTEQKRINTDDFLALLKATEGKTVADLRDRAIILFLYDTACRVGGLCGLRLNDLDLEQGLGVVTEKGEKSRFVMFTQDTRQALQDWLEVRPQDKGPWVFVGLNQKSKGQLQTGGVGQMLRRRAKQAGCAGPTNPHSFRHGFAKAYLMGGGDLGTLADIMGHSDVGVTKNFYGIFTLAELRDKHRKHSPVAKILGGESDDG